MQAVVVVTMVESFDVVPQGKGIPCFFVDWRIRCKVTNHTFCNAGLLNILCMAQEDCIAMGNLIFEEEPKVFDKHRCLHCINGRN